MNLPLPEWVALLRTVTCRGQFLGLTVAADGSAIAVYAQGTVRFDRDGNPLEEKKEVA